jgi:hypothetical protein
MKLNHKNRKITSNLKYYNLINKNEIHIEKESYL